MAKTEIDRAVQPSLLDRLTDEFPREPADRSTTREASARAFRLSVQRDVEWLLNTRRTMVHETVDQVELRRSVHQYGLPDTSGLSLSNIDGRRKLTEDITDTIRRFEPRLTGVDVRLVERNSPTEPQLRFTVSATLLMDPSPELIVFDTVLEVASGVYEVNGQR